MNAVAIIPARLAATRLPNKPLLDIAGKPMIQHVYERAQRAQTLSAVYVATPDPEIFEVVVAFGGHAIMTSPDHRTGTDRIAEAAQTLPPDVEIVVNVQGDEPLIDPETIDAAVRVSLPREEEGREKREERTPNTPHSRHPLFAGASDGRPIPNIQHPIPPPIVSSLMCPLPEGRENDPNVVKVVTDTNGDALYFSRSPLPYRRNPDMEFAPMQHIGLYAYRRDFLTLFPTLPQTPLERIESLEQLRVLEHGYKIRMVQTARIPESVDTPDDLERVRRLFALQANREV